MRKSIAAAMFFLSACSPDHEALVPTSSDAPRTQPTSTNTVVTEPRPTLEQVVTLAPTQVSFRQGFHPDTDDPVCCTSESVLLNRARLLSAIRNAKLAYPFEHAPEYALVDWMYLYRCTDGPNCYAYLTEPVAYGDLDRDGYEDLAGVIVAGFGGDIGYDLVAVLDRESAPEITPLESIGRRIILKRLEISEGNLTVVMEMWEDNNWEQACWKDGQDGIVYRYVAGRLECERVRDIPPVP